MLGYDRIDVLEGIDVNKQIHQKNVIFVIISIFRKYLCRKFKQHVCNNCHKKL